MCSVHDDATNFSCFIASSCRRRRHSWKRTQVSLGERPLSAPLEEISFLSSLLFMDHRAEENVLDCPDDRQAEEGQTAQLYSFYPAHESGMRIDSINSIKIIPGISIPLRAIASLIR